MPKPLTDQEVYDLMHECLILISQARGESTLSDTALKALRYRIIQLQGALLMKMEGKLTETPE